MTLTYDDLEQIRTFGEENVECDEIIKLLNIEDSEEFKTEFADVSSVIYLAYNSGIPKSIDRLNNELTKKASIESKILDIKLDNFQRRMELRKQLFGV